MKKKIKEKRIKEKCECCGKSKFDIEYIKTFDGKTVAACPGCREDMKFTLRLMKLGGISLRKRAEK